MSPTDIDHKLEVISARLAVVSEQLAVQTDRAARMDSTVKGMASEISEIKGYANHWKGGFYAMAGAGAFLTAMAAFWDRIRHWF